jgi:hypothetical protein
MEQTAAATPAAAAAAAATQQESGTADATFLAAFQAAMDRSHKQGKKEKGYEVQIQSLKRRLQEEQQDSCQQRRRVTEWQQEAEYQKAQARQQQEQYHSLRKETELYRYGQRLDKSGL